LPATPPHTPRPRAGGKVRPPIRSRLGSEGTPPLPQAHRHLTYSLIVTENCHDTSLAIVWNRRGFDARACRHPSLCGLLRPRPHPTTAPALHISSRPRLARPTPLPRRLPNTSTPSLSSPLRRPAMHQIPTSTPRSGQTVHNLALLHLHPAMHLARLRAIRIRPRPQQVRSPPPIAKRPHRCPPSTVETTPHRSRPIRLTPPQRNRAVGSWGRTGGTIRPGSVAFPDVPPHSVGPPEPPPDVHLERGWLASQAFTWAVLCVP